MYDCFVLRKVCRSKILLVIILVLHQFFFYLKRILNFSETFVTYNCSLFSTIFIEICPWWVLIAKLRNLLDFTKDWVISSIIREYVHLSCERFLLQRKDWVISSIIREYVHLSCERFLLQRKITPFTRQVWFKSRNLPFCSHNLKQHEVVINSYFCWYILPYTYPHLTRNAFSWKVWR